MPTSASVRMYRLHELGDCFLVTFDVDGAVSRMLIDCGSFRNSKASVDRLQQIADHLHTLDSHTDGARAKTRLDVVVGTHQHNDHVSGFYHCHSTFDQIGIGEVWLSWLDDPLDRAAQAIGKDHGNLTAELTRAAKGLRALSGAGGPVALHVLDDILGFYGATDAATERPLKGKAKKEKRPPVRPAAAIERLRKLRAKRPPRYLSPGNIVDMPGLPKGRVRIHVLGPPRQHDFLYRANPRADESYDHALTASLASADKFLKAVGHLHGTQSSGDRRVENDYPFTHTLKCNNKISPALAEMIATYANRNNSWRTIDYDWLNQAQTLALFLDTYTNNSSLALAIELVDSGKVLLFAADAQVGNWRSWAGVKWERKRVTTDDLLKRTVFYKVGHHASHNATLKPVLDTKMTHPDLCALVPVHRNDPNIKKTTNGWKMPARNLFRFLKTKASNRVLRMDIDDEHDDGCHPDMNKAAWKAIGVKPEINDLYIELGFGETRKNRTAGKPHDDKRTPAGSTRARVATRRSAAKRAPRAR